MRKRKQKYKSVITQRIKHSVKKIGAILSVLFLVLSLNQLKGTNAYFTDNANVTGINFTTGWWIPSLEMAVDKIIPDGKNGFYKTAPCVTLTANIHGDSSGIKIYYKFSEDGDPITNGSIYNGECIKVPDGNPTYFEAQAVNKKNTNWKSNIVTGNWKVDTIAPVVKITNPEKDNKLSGTVAIRGTVTDVNPDHYWLVIENSDGDKVAGPGTVNDNTSFMDKKFFSWDTTEVPDGDYTVKLEARDQVGNNDDDSANVKVKNNPDVGDVVINEVMWMGSSEKSSDEWIELRNMTDHDINLKNWNIDGAVSGGGGHLEIAGGQNDIISANGYFLIANYSKNNSAINVEPGFVSASISFNNKYNENGKLVLKDKDGNIIDSTPDPSGHNWPAGSDGNVKESMERNNDPGDGTESSSWHTCVDEEANDDTYWDVTNNDDGKNYGTPGAVNLSKNDPTSPDYDPNFKDGGKNKKKVVKKVTKKILPAKAVKKVADEPASVSVIDKPTIAIKTVNVIDKSEVISDLDKKKSEPKVELKPKVKSELKVAVKKIQLAVIKTQVKVKEKELKKTETTKSFSLKIKEPVNNIEPKKSLTNEKAKNLKEDEKDEEDKDGKLNSESTKESKPKTDIKTSQKEPVKKVIKSEKVIKKNEIKVEDKGEKKNHLQRKMISDCNS